MKIQEITDEQKQELRKKLREVVKSLEEIDRLKQGIGYIRNDKNWLATRMNGMVRS